jgi:hypothetical protein
MRLVCCTAHDGTNPHGCLPLNGNLSVSTLNFCMTNIEPAQPAIVFWLQHPGMELGAITRFDHPLTQLARLWNNRPQKRLPSFGSERWIIISTWNRSEPLQPSSAQSQGASSPAHQSEGGDRGVGALSCRVTEHRSSREPRASQRNSPRALQAVTVAVPSCSPWIFLVCRETVTLPKPKLIFG